MNIIPYDPYSDPYQIWGQALKSMFGGMEKQYQQGLLGKDVQAIQGMGRTQDIFNTMYGARGLQAPRAQFPRLRSPMGQKMFMNNAFADPRQREYQDMRNALLRHNLAEAKNPNLSVSRQFQLASGLTRLSENYFQQALYTEDTKLREELYKKAKKAREDANVILASINRKLPREQPVEPTGKPVKPTARPSVEPTTEDLEAYRKMGLKEYTSPSGKKYPLTTRLEPPETAEELEDYRTKLLSESISPTPLATDKSPEKIKRMFEKYPTPKTERVFNNTISHIRPKENRKVYFEIILKRISKTNSALAKKLYDRWSDEVYE